MQKEGRTLYGVANRTYQKAVDFAEKYGVTKVYGDIPDLFADEQVGILLMNSLCEMAAASLSLHAKQPKRGMVAFDKGYLEIYEYPRAEKAVITFTDDNHQEIIECGKTEDALRYEVHDMERAVSGDRDEMHLDCTMDVMKAMTEMRKSWEFVYPEEK